MVSHVVAVAANAGRMNFLKNNPVQKAAQSRLAQSRPRGGRHASAILYTSPVQICGIPCCMNVAGRARRIGGVLPYVVLIAFGSGDEIVALTGLDKRFKFPRARPRAPVLGFCVQRGNQST